VAARAAARRAPARADDRRAARGRTTISVTSPAACDGCLRRAALIAALAPWLDVEWRKRSAPAGVLSLPDEELVALDGSGRTARAHAVFSPRQARERIVAARLAALCRCDDGYPERLRELADPPSVLHVAGNLAALDGVDAVAIVGARRGTAYGLEVSRSLGRGLTAAGIPVVSGMAMGVDSAAHTGALEAQGAAPVAVLAGGADVAYPASRRRLHAELIARGCVVSELPPGFTAFRWCFVARNRLIAGLAALTVVVEATERSGSLTTADFAQQLGRPVGAVPGPVTSRFSAGTNSLLAAGAGLVRDTRDVLDQLLGPSDRRAAEPPPTPAVALEPRLRCLLDAIERGHGSLAELTSDPEATRQVLQDLTELELRGLVRREFGGRYVRALEERW
jgi:DNA processing protein